MKGDEQMDLLELFKYNGAADKAMGVMFGSAAVQVISSHATEITLAITFFSFLVMWFYKHRTVQQDKKYKQELIKIKKGEYSKELLSLLKESPNVCPEQLQIIQKKLEDPSQE